MQWRTKSFGGWQLESIDIYTLKKKNTFCIPKQWLCVSTRVLLQQKMATGRPSKCRESFEECSSSPIPWFDIPLAHPKQIQNAKHDQRRDNPSVEQPRSQRLAIPCTLCVRLVVSLRCDRPFSERSRRKPQAGEAEREKTLQSASCFTTGNACIARLLWRHAVPSERHDP